MPVGCVIRRAHCISVPTPCCGELKKKAPVLEAVNTALLRTLNPAEVAWDVERAGAAEAERDARWSLVGHPGPPRWLWQAIAPYTGKVVADVLGAVPVPTGK